MVDLEEFELVWAGSRGIIELGSVRVERQGREFVFDVEESNLGSWHQFKVWLHDPEEREELGVEVDPEGRVLDERFVNFVRDLYASGDH